MLGNYDKMIPDMEEVFGSDRKERERDKISTQYGVFLARFESHAISR